MNTAGNLTGSALEEFYVNIKSGAESGWDFSTRWFVSNEGTAQADLKNIKTRDIIPVDLNSFICMNARLLSKLFSLIGDEVRSQVYLEKFFEFKEAIQQVCRLNYILFEVRVIITQYGDKF